MKSHNNNWTDQENWVWDQIKDGNDADLNKYFWRDQTLFSAIPQYRTRVVINAGFLESILTDKRYKKSIHTNSVVIRNADIINNFSLINSDLSVLLIFEQCVFRGMYI